MTPSTHGIAYTLRGLLESWEFVRDDRYLDAVVTTTEALMRKLEVLGWLPGSYEALFHAAGLPRFLLTLRDGGEAADALRRPRLERAIGVIYRPQTERLSHYFHARLADQFDAVLHFDRTTALHPSGRR